MPVTHKRQGDNAIYQLAGPFDAPTAHELIDLNAADYRELGEALGAVIDFRQVSNITISGLRVVQNRLSNLSFEAAPVALLGQPDSLLTTFMRGLEALTSRGHNRYKVCTSQAEALLWLDGWFAQNELNREMLRGHIVTQYYPRSTTE
jgi:hypothetical protein